MKNITLKVKMEIRRKVLGEWHSVNIPTEQFDSVWSRLCRRKPYWCGGSLHVYEERYRMDMKTYHVFFNNGSDTPFSIGIRTKYNWKELNESK